MNSSPALKTEWTWEEWRRSRAARRAIAERIGPPVVRRAESTSDRKLRAAFDGKRGPDFGSDTSSAQQPKGPPAEQLPDCREESSGETVASRVNKGRIADS